MKDKVMGYRDFFVLGEKTEVKYERGNYHMQAELVGGAVIELNIPIKGTDVKYRYEKVMEIETIPSFREWNYGVDTVNEIKEDYTKYKLKGFLNDN